MGCNDRTNDTSCIIKNKVDLIVVHPEYRSARPAVVQDLNFPPKNI